jgi:hypothetical protein
MKRMLLCIIGLALTAPVVLEAQTRWGVKGGVNFATVTVDDHIGPSPNAITGFHVGPVVETMARHHSSIGTEAAILFTRKGFELNHANIASDYIEVPLSLKWRLNLPVVRPYLKAGPYASILVSKDYYSIESFSLEAKRFNAGVNLDLGVDIMHLQLGLNFNWGLTNTYAANDAAYKYMNRTFALTAALLL